MNVERLFCPLKCDGNITQEVRGLISKYTHDILISGDEYKNIEISDENWISFIMLYSINKEKELNIALNKVLSTHSNTLIVYKHFVEIYNKIINGTILSEDELLLVATIKENGVGKLDDIEKLNEVIYNLYLRINELKDNDKQDFFSTLQSIEGRISDYGKDKNGYEIDNSQGNTIRDKYLSITNEFISSDLTSYKDLLDILMKIPDNKEEYIRFLSEICSLYNLYLSLNKNEHGCYSDAVISKLESLLEDLSDNLDFDKQEEKLKGIVTERLEEIFEIIENRDELAYDILLDSALLHSDGISLPLYEDNSKEEKDNALALLERYKLIKYIKINNKFIIEKSLQEMIRDLLDG